MERLNLPISPYCRPARRHNLAGLFFVCALAAFLFSTTAASSWAQEPGHAAAGWVVLPVEEYRTLRAKAFPKEHEPAPPPVEATLSRVDYDLQVNGDLAAGRASLTVDVLKEGWVRVPIPAGLLVREARLDGKLLSLVSTADGKGSSHLAAVLSHPGRATLLFDIALPVIASAGDESIVLPATASGVTRAAVQLPRTGLDIRLAGGLLAEKSEAATASKWIAYGRGNEPLTFTWHRKIEDHHLDQPLRLRGSLTQLLGLGEDATSLYAEVNIEVMQGAARRVAIQLPDKVAINQVSGAVVADWEVKPHELDVTFLEPVEQSARFVIVGESNLPRDGKMEAPLLRLIDAERETGGVAVEVLGAGEIKDHKAQGMENADPTDLGEMIASRQSPSMLALRFRSGDSKSSRSLTLDVARYVQQAVLMANIEEARYQVLMSNEGKMLVEARYAIRNNQRNFVKITLPAGATLWSASLGGKPVRPGKATDESLLLPLQKSRSGKAPVFAVEILYVTRGPAWGEKGEAKLALPAVDLPISRTGVQLYYPPLFRVSSGAGGAFRTSPYEDPSSVALEGRAGGDEEKSYPASQPAAPQTHGATKSLVDQYLKDSGDGRRAGILPMLVSFPTFGPSLFLISELTAENQAPTVGLTYQRDKKAGNR